MLETLFGNKNIERILIFLFVNGRCYGTQLHTLFKIPLTPLQKALLRLEKGEIIKSYYEGKTRLYEFNQTYPLLAELELLLKKAYTLLNPSEKKNYYVIKNEHHFKSNSENILELVWARLATVKSLSFSAKTKSKEPGGWQGKGAGEVTVTEEKKDVLIFTEKGSWSGINNKEIHFRNVFRWTFDRKAKMISLEHLRRGIDHPVFLFHLVHAGSDLLTSLDAHLCEGDSYFGHMRCIKNALCLSFRVIGKKKNEEMDYYYT